MRTLLHVLLVALVLTVVAAPALAAPHVDLSWGNPDTLATSINILRATGACAVSPALPPCVFAPLVTLPGTATTYTDTGVVDGGTYTYEVNGSNATGTGPNVQVGVTVPIPLAVPAARSNLIAVPTP